MKNFKKKKEKKNPWKFKKSVGFECFPIRSFQFSIDLVVNRCREIFRENDWLWKSREKKIIKVLLRKKNFSRIETLKKKFKEKINKKQ